MGMAKGHWRRTRSVNDSYQHRYKKKPAKGIGFYAYQLPGAGPNGIHIREKGCRCGGCSA